MSLQTELESLRDALRDMTPAEKELAVRVAADLTQLQGRHLLGEDVESELNLAKAAALSLTEAAKERMRAWLNERAQNAMGILVGIL